MAFARALGSYVVRYCLVSPCLHTQLHRAQDRPNLVNRRVGACETVAELNGVAAYSSEVKELLTANSLALPAGALHQ